MRRRQQEQPPLQSQLQRHDPDDEGDTAAKEHHRRWLHQRLSARALRRGAFCLIGIVVGVCVVVTCAVRTPDATAASAALLRGGKRDDRVGVVGARPVPSPSNDDDDDGASLVREILLEDPPEERGEREGWASHEGWHRKEDVHVRGHIRVPEEQQRRVIAVGDVHGDKAALVRALQLAKLVQDPGDNNDDAAAWIGGTDVLVQIGDLLNAREPRDREVFEYVTALERQARAAGGEIIVILGDHDLHNAPALWPDLRQKEDEPFPPWMMGVARIIDRTLFVHGSLSSQALEDAGGTVDGMNRAVAAWLGGGGGAKPGWLGRGDGPVFSRLYSDRASDATPRCDDLRKLLDGLGVDRMVVGHTVRREGISSSCDGRVWRIDVGLSETESRAGKIGASEVLEVSGGGTAVRVLSTDVKLKTWK